MKVKKRWIKVNTEFKGIHNWPECPYEDVSFLQHPHRHTFEVGVKVVIGHYDREIEFFRFQRDVNAALIELYGASLLRTRDLGRRSCEEIAEDLYHELYEKYPREMIITVSEDGEVAAEIEFEPEDKSE